MGSMLNADRTTNPHYAVQWPRVEARETRDEKAEIQLKLGPFWTGKDTQRPLNQNPTSLDWLSTGHPCAFVNLDPFSNLK